MNEQIKENSEKLLKLLPSLDEEELSKLVTYHNDRYFLLSDPEISDEAFDKLLETLKFLNPLNPIISIIEKFKGENVEKIAHEKPMLSLDKCYDDETFKKWQEKIKGSIIAMPKIDGVALSLIYNEKGELTFAKTRGDGFFGENITKNIFYIESIPKKINNLYKKTEIRGEIYMPLSVFKEKYQQDFSSPRNLAAGALKQKEAHKTKDFGLKFFPYDFRQDGIESEKEKFENLDKIGFPMMPIKEISNTKEAKEYFLYLFKEKSNLDYEIDGAVFKANLMLEQERLGETAHHPRFAIAYKFQGESAQTKLLRVEWQVARTGAITPVAIVNPVFVSGASIERASLHNFSIFLHHDLREETLVEIVRKGGVIPYLEKVLTRKGEKLLPPSNCPSCHGEVYIEGEFLYCKNPEKCEEVVVEKIFHFCQTLEIEGLGEKILRKLFKAKLIKNFSDIFLLKKEDFLALERMGDLLATKLINQIQNKKTITLAIFLRALGIREVGQNISTILANHFGDLQKILALKKEELLELHGIGESIADSFVAYINNNKNEIEELLKIIYIKKEDNFEVKNIENPLYGKTILFTGKMAHLDRKSAQKKVKELGGKALDGMTKEVDFLVVGDEGSPLLGAGIKSTKQKQAEKMIKESHHIKIISELEFLNFIK